MRHGRRPDPERDRVHELVVARDLGLLAGATVALRLPAYLASAHLTFDDGVFGASAVAMRAGYQPYREVFSSQGPLFLPLVWVFDLLGLRTANAPRLLSLAAALVLVGGTYAAGRVVTDRGGALFAAGLVSATTTSLWITGPLAADGAALAFATATMAMVLRWRHEVTVRRAMWIGLGIGATVSVKALLAPVIVPAALVLLAGRRLAPDRCRRRDSHRLPPAALAPVGDRERVGAVVRVPPRGRLRSDAGRQPGQGPQHDGRSRRHRAGRGHPGARRRGAAPTGGRTRRRAAVGRPRTSSSSRGWPPPSSSSSGSTRCGALTCHSSSRASRCWPPAIAPRGAVIVVAGIVLLPYYVVHAWPVLHPDPYRGSAAEAVDLLRTLPDGALAISDEPGLVWRAGLRTPPDLVDASILRMQTGDLTSASIAAVAGEPDVCAVVVRSGERWGSFDDLPDRLADAGYEVAAEDGEVRRVYLKPDCRPPT